jgi:glycine/D-amino acid oxidase-like deaminating enzyme
VVGLAVGRELALAGHEVMVLESQNAIGTGIASFTGTTGAAMLMIRPMLQAGLPTCQGPKTEPHLLAKEMYGLIKMEWIHSIP